MGYLVSVMFICFQCILPCACRGKFEVFTRIEIYMNIASIHDLTPINQLTTNMHRITQLLRQGIPDLLAVSERIVFFRDIAHTPTIRIEFHLNLTSGQCIQCFVIMFGGKENIQIIHDNETPVSLFGN